MTAPLIAGLSGPSAHLQPIDAFATFERSSRSIRTSRRSPGPKLSIAVSPLLPPRQNAGYGNPLYFNAFYEDVLNNERVLSQDAINKTETASIFISSDFELDFLNGANWDTEFLFTRRETDAEGWRQFFPFIASATLAPFGFGYADDPTYDNPFRSLVRPVLLFPSNSSVEVDYYSFSTGLEGDFAGMGIGFLEDWAWSFNAMTSKSEGSYGGIEILQSLSGDWQFSDSAPTFDPFDPAVLSGEDISWYDQVSSYETGNTTYEQSSFTAILTGPLFELPAGDVLVAFGVEGREFSIDDQPSEASRNGDLWGKTSALVTKGEDDVFEYFAELEVPLLAGQPGFEELTINGSFRAFNYASYGTGIDWGNSSNENIRANCAADGIPATFAGGTTSAEIITGGGQDILEAETSDAITVGFVFTPTFSDLSIAIDYFDITVEDQVSRLGAGAILGGCYGAQNFPNAFCDLFVRNSAADPLAPNAIDTVTDSFLNVNEQTTRGIDITGRYERSFNFGDIVAEVQATRTLEDISLLFDADSESGFDVDDFNGTIGDPEWVGNGRVSLTRGDFTYSWFFDYVGETDNSELFTNTQFSYFGRQATRIYEAESRLYHDLSVRWTGDQISIIGGVSNILDSDPPIISTGTATRRGNIPLVGGYDLFGRTAFIRATKTF